MQIQVDTREKQHAITKIIKYFDDAGIQHFSSKMHVGDYMSVDNPRLVIDRKKDLLEICQNLCQGHERFTNELTRAKELGWFVIVLCEHGGNIKTLDDVRAWVNPRIKEYPLAMSGERLYKVMKTMSNSEKYNVSFEFCNKNQTGKRIVELLSTEVKK